MAFEPASRDWSMNKYPKKASTTYTAGMMLYNDETDNVPVATTTQNNLLGICMESYATTDTTTTKIHVLEPNSLNSTFYADVTGTLTAAMEGDQFDFAAGALTIAQAASTYDTVTLVKYINSTKGVFRFNVLHGKD